MSRAFPVAFRWMAALVAATALLALALPSSAVRAEPSLAPKGCEVLATVVYSECRARHVVACAAEPDVRLLQEVQDGQFLWSHRFDYGFDLITWTHVPTGRVFARRRLSGASGAAVLGGDHRSEPYRRRVEGGELLPDGFIAQYTVDMVIREARPESLRLASGAEGARVFVVTLEWDFGQRLESRLWWSPELEAWLGWRGRALTAGAPVSDWTPLAVRRPGEPGFLSNGGPGCAVG